MTATARATAEDATFQAFIHCYLREIDGGHWTSPGHLELKLPGQRLKLKLEALYRSTVGRHRFGRILCQQASVPDWQQIAPFAAVQLLIREIYLSSIVHREQAAACELEILSRVAESYQVMARYLAARQDDPALASNRFINSEQSLLFGHWAHPTPKSRQGMVDWTHDHYAPELRGSFRLHLFSVDRDLTEQRSVCGRSAETLIRDCLGLAGAEDGSVMVPVHPLQATWLLQQPAIRAAIESGQIRDRGPRGPAFSATSSVRTVYHPDLPWMLKFSIPVKVTNSRRINKHSELTAGVTMARLLRRTGFARRNPRFRTLDDPAYLTVRLPGLRESGFEIIVRENPFVCGRDNGIHSVAAVTQAPLPHKSSRLRTLIEGLALAEGRPPAAVSRDWFGYYLDCAIEPAIRLLDDHGIALEAHQQNSLLDLSAGYPRRYYYRDNQGFYLSPAYRAHLQSLDPAVCQVPELFYDDAVICDRFIYYLFFNQLFAVIHRFGEDRLIDERALLELTRQRLQLLQRELTGAGRDLVTAVLERPQLAYKGNLLTRLQDIDELQAHLEQAVYTRLPNPLMSRAGQTTQEASYEVA